MTSFANNTCEDSDTASVHSATTTSHFDDSISISSSSPSVVSSTKRKTKGMKKRVSNLFRKRKNTVPEIIQEKEDEVLPIQELQPSRPLLDCQSAGMLAMRRFDSEDEEDEVHWVAARPLLVKASTSERTLKVENPTKYRPSTSTQPLCTNVEGCIMVAIMLVLINLSCEIRFKGVLLNPGGLSNLIGDLTRGRMSIIAVIARELATLVMSSLITMVGIVTVICSLEPTPIQKIVVAEKVTAVTPTEDAMKDIKVACPEDTILHEEEQIKDQGNGPNGQQTIPSVEHDLELITEYGSI